VLFVFLEKESFLINTKRSECNITSMPNQASVIASECKRMNKKTTRVFEVILMRP
jgi:cellobiose phosphorylase